MWYWEASSRFGVYWRAAWFSVPLSFWTMNFCQTFSLLRLMGQDSKSANGIQEGKIVRYSNKHFYENFSENECLRVDIQEFILKLG